MLESSWLTLVHLSLLFLSFTSSDTSNLPGPSHFETVVLVDTNKMDKFHEKESSKRSWPWKKKSTDKVSAAPELAGASPIHSSRLLDDHQVRISVSKIFLPKLCHRYLESNCSLKQLSLLQKWDYHHQEVSMHHYQPSPPRVPSAVPKHLKEAKDAHVSSKSDNITARFAIVSSLQKYTTRGSYGSGGKNQHLTARCNAGFAGAGERCPWSQPCSFG
jgi:hypothetical protein